MATLAITIDGDRGPDGYPMEGTAYRFYCDRCGSFRISRFIRPATRLGLLLTCVLAGVGWQRLGSTRGSGADWLSWWAAFAMFCLPALSAVLAFHGHKCHKCGNTAISNLDVLDYAHRETQTYDVRLERLHTHDTLRNRWYKELIDLLVMVGMVPVVLLMVVVMEIGMMVALVVSAFRPEETHHQGLESD